MDTIRCRRCERDTAPLPAPPFRNPLGDRIEAEICRDCWGDWLQHQTLLINHYGLDPRDPKARAFLFDQIETVLLGGGETDPLDTSREGSVNW